MIGHEIHDLAHASLDDVCEVLHTYFLRWHSPQSRYRDVRIRLCFIGECATKLNFHLLGLRLKYAKTILDIIRDVLTGKWNDCRMFKNPFIKNGEVSSTTANVNNGDTCFEIFLAHN